MCCYPPYIMQCCVKSDGYNRWDSLLLLSRSSRATCSGNGNCSALLDSSTHICAYNILFLKRDRLPAVLQIEFIPLPVTIHQRFHRMCLAAHIQKLLYFISLHSAYILFFCGAFFNRLVVARSQVLAELKC
jgi:hypothetical protein